MAKRTKLDHFQKAVQEVLNEYEGYISGTVLTEAVHETAKDTSEVVQANAPVRTGAYKSTINYGYPQRKRNAYTETVYADAPGFRLAHLLENGHASRNGGRVDARPHWETGEQGIDERLIKHIKDKL